MPQLTEAQKSAMPKVNWNMPSWKDIVAFLQWLLSVLNPPAPPSPAPAEAHKALLKASGCPDACVEECACCLHAAGLCLQAAKELFEHCAKHCPQG